MKIIHVDTGKEWRGGQRQAQFLHEGLLESGFQSILVCNADGQFPKRGVESIVPMKFKGETDLSFMRELKKLIRMEKPDIVHTHDAHSLTPALLTKVMGTNFKLINTRRVDFSVNKGYFSRKKYDNRQVDVIVAISRAIRDMLINDGVSKSKVRLINSGVRFPKSINYQLYRELIEKYELYGKYVIGNVANISDHKDQKTLIDAFVRFRSEAENAVLMIVGGGPLYAEIKAYAESSPYSDSIVFTGHTENVYEHLALFDVFCMSSKTEGLCTSIIDAMFMMRPVAATAAGGIPELVKDNFNGLLTPVKDADALSESFNLMYDDRDLADKFSSNGFHTALKFSDNAMVSSYIRLYEELSRI
ncbi:glycosyltransferase [Seleniivibrio sp.]|nr:glycosyltransferase [Seleniivibrio sp.]MCD8553278.1 glycosyltransferase [Seleniivibrio sp.]